MSVCLLPRGLAAQHQVGVVDKENTCREDSEQEDDAARQKHEIGF